MPIYLVASNLFATLLYNIDTQCHNWHAHFMENCVANIESETLRNIKRSMGEFHTHIRIPLAIRQQK